MPGEIITPPRAAAYAIYTPSSATASTPASSTASSSPPTLPAAPLPPRKRKATPRQSPHPSASSVSLQLDPYSLYQRAHHLLLSSSRADLTRIHTPRPRPYPRSPTRNADRPLAHRANFPKIHLRTWQAELADMPHLGVKNLPVAEEGDLEFAWHGSKATMVPLDVAAFPYNELLSTVESRAASRLRLEPAQYITVKRRLIEAERIRVDQGLWLRRTEAQQLCRVDVNKVGAMMMWFRDLGWMADGPRAPVPSSSSASKDKRRSGRPSRK